MPYLIDGNNLLGRSKEINLKTPHARDVLINELLAFQKEKNVKMIVVFDGLPDERIGKDHISLGDVEIRFAGEKSDADSLILKIIMQSSEPSSFILVSSDRSLTDKARFMKAKVLKCHQFRKKMERVKANFQSKLEPKLDKEEIAEWLDFFSNPENKKT